jgi:predicted AAA+ superfamily ATPase
MIKRNIEEFGYSVLNEYNKMFFVSGPKQSGKTTFAKMLLRQFSKGSYVSRDIISDQKK